MSLKPSVCSSSWTGGGSTLWVPRGGVGPGRSLCRAQRYIQPTISPPTFSEGDTFKYGAQLSEPARRGIGSATDLASTDDASSLLQSVPDSVLDSLPDSEIYLTQDFTPVEVPLEQLAAIPACERNSKLGSFFDDLASELQPMGADCPVNSSKLHQQRPPRARRSPRNVVPASADTSSSEPLFDVPHLPRTITPRPNLPSHRAPKILHLDEWLLQPQPSADVAARLRRNEAMLQQQLSSDPFHHSEESDWSPQRTVPLLKALTASSYHANVFELVSFICSSHSQALASLDLSRKPITRMLEKWSRSKASAPTAVLLVKSGLDVHKPAHNVTSSYSSEDSYPSARVLRAALASASLVGDVGSSRRFFEELRRTSVSIDGQAFGLLIAAHGQAGEWRQATQLLTQMQSSGIMPTVKTYTTLIKACTSAGAPNRAVELFAEMEADGVSADLLAYNSLLGAFSRCGEWARAWSVLGAMRRAGVDPDIVSYNTLLKACERAGKWPRVLEVYARLLRECEEGSGRLRPNVITFNTLIGAAGHAKEWKHALQFMDEMHEWDLSPDKVTMSSLVNALESAGEWQLAISKFEELRGMGIQPNVICYNATISALAKGSQAEAAKELVATMQRQGLNPDIYTYAPLVGALGGAGRVEEAMQVWDDMRAAGVEPNSYVYVALINACERSSDWRRALRVFHTMKDSGVEMNTLSLAARQILYHWPQVLQYLPPAIVKAARAAVDTGRAARDTVHQALKDVPTHL